MPAFLPTLARLLRWLTRRLVRFYYPRIGIGHPERLPATGPVLFVANHANSLLDPVIIGIVAQRPVRFLAKAPIFQVPVFGALLQALGMLPAYRGSDDRTQVAKNTESLTGAATALARGEAAGIFPEGKSHDALTLEPIKGGAARIALQAQALGATNLLVVPLGINYQRKEQFRSSVWVEVGPPIRVADLLADGADPDKRTQRALTEQIEAQLRAAVIHLGDASWEPFLHDLELLLPGTETNNSLSALRQRKRLAAAINQAMDQDRHRALRIAVALQRFRSELAPAGLELRSPVLRLAGRRLAANLLGRLLRFGAGLVPWLPGTAHHLVPFLVVRTLARFWEAPGRMTRALIRLLVSLPLYGLWYGAVWWSMAQYFRPAVATVWAALMVPCGLWALSGGRQLRELARDGCQELRSLKQRQQIAAWRLQRQQLSQQLAKLASDYPLLAEPEPSTVGRARSSRRLALPVACLGLALALGIGTTAWWRVRSRTRPLPELAAESPLLGRLSHASLEKMLAEDATLLAALVKDIRQLEAQAETVKAQFDSGQRSFYRQEDDETIRRLLFHYLSARTELLRLLWRYQDPNQVSDPALQARCFLLAYTSGTILFDMSGRFVELFADSPRAIRKLNEPEPRWEIPANLYNAVLGQLQLPANRRLLAQAASEHAQRAPGFQQLGLVTAQPYDQFQIALAQAQQRIAQRSLPTVSTPRAVLQEAAQIGQQGLYWGQSLVSTWVGDTRVRRPRSGQALVRPEHLTQMRAQLQPGDILIERQNWFLSRAFMPGYWAHAALYVGTPGQLRQLGLDQDPRVSSKWAEFVKPDATGHELVIIEAVPRGVRITSLEHCIGVADSAAVLRPRLTPAQRREAIAQAFSHLGKPYDFEFDFFSTDKLVCTELVYRCYDGVLRFDLVNVMGRLTLPPTELVRTHLKTSQQGQPQFDLVLFLDGDESAGIARVRDQTAFAETVNRPALTWLQHAP